MLKEFSAGIVVFFKRDDEIRYLLLHYAAGHWDFPKGHIDPGETKQEAAVRELQEETGLSAKITPSFEYSFSYNFKSYDDNELRNKTVFFFTGQVFEKQVILSHEHQDYRWLPYKEARKQLTYANAQQLLDNVHDFILSKQHE